MIKQCIICHKDFETKQPAQTICGDPECRRKRNNRTSIRWQNENRERLKEHYKRSCPECHKAFETTNVRKIYCSHDCQVSHAAHKKYPYSPKRQKSKAVKKRTPHDDLVEASKAAHEAGMTYGQWQAMREGRLKC